MSVQEARERNKEEGKSLVRELHQQEETEKQRKADQRSREPAGQYVQAGYGGDSNEWKYGILRAAEEVVRAEILSYAPVSESEHVSPVSPFIDWSGFVGWFSVVAVLFVWFALVVFFLGSLTNLCD